MSIVILVQVKLTILDTLLFEFPLYILISTLRTFYTSPLRTFLNNIILFLQITTYDLNTYIIIFISLFILPHTFHIFNGIIFVLGLAAVNSINIIQLPISNPTPARVIQIDGSGREGVGCIKNGIRELWM